ncbi:DNA translocase FtsK [Acinetobacter shaoyimingii]|uniref:DNA translocase FtsK n=1 Tax=Acinetobacter shaoyimingii TaxID=2715164 RepID=A0A6G8RTD8_9GAMM|nr:DNA translocase FtsK [Acinetobacter shaoyimingii]NHB58810.1 DNA translocase FtsK [Acinetobacter shaoyimingii]QIO05202.1 DNA translocase FtsK [Acinetobacter shaoyimingii]
MTAVSSVYAQRLLLTFFLISFGIYLFLATVTYTPFDPGWMHISSDTQQVSNASGVAGAWIADLLFGFLGWASLLIPLFFFIEAIQTWWPRSFLSHPFRYAAQFFILLTTATLVYLLWHVPADTLTNASGGIIGFELGESLSNLLSIYGAVLFLAILDIVLLTLAFGIQWNKTWVTLKATPAYLQELFYKNVPESESDYDLTSPISQKKSANTQQSDHDQTAQVSETQSVDQAQPQPVKNKKSEQIAERLFQDIQSKENSIPFSDPDDDAEFEKTLEKAHRLEAESRRVVPTGEVWKALHQEDDHKREIDELLRSAEDDLDQLNQNAKQSHDFDQLVSKQSHTQHSDPLDWNDDQVFDELLSVVPNGQQATDVHSPFNATVAAPLAQSATVQALHSTEKLAAELDDLASLADDTDFTTTERSQTPQLSSYAQSTPFVKANIQVDTPTSIVSEEEKRRIAADKDAFREAWQETVGAPEEENVEDEFDLDAPLTDAYGRPMSRAMQVAQKRRDLSPLPGLEILDKVDPNKKVNFTAEQLARLSELLEIKLQEFNVKAKVIEAQPGPVVTRFELDLAPGVKASKVTNISRDLARSMSMASVRVVEVIPGKPYIGIEVPNSSREMVRLIELLETPAYRDPNALLSMAMGKDISGNPVLADLAKAPHMLVAGTTGSGKSVAVNAMLLSMLLKYTPEQLRLIMIDPKQLELANYNDIPHLLTPVVTDMKDAVSALNWCVNEMERRYKLMSLLKVRKLTDFNRKVEEAIANGEDLIDPTWKPDDSATQSRAPRLQPMPLIVIVADEFADMIMQVGKKAEEMITRLAQKSRAAGIHLLLATQRPTVDVVTGLIKANIPTRAALRVNSKLDSRTILDAGGAEDLLGHGDMLFLGPGKIEPERVHGAFISDDEVNRICDAWRERGSPNYIDEILTPYDEEPSSRGFEDGDGGSDRDALYDQCVSFVLETRKASTSSLQRKFSLGYNRAARIIDQMEENGIVSPMGANGKRDILV